MAGHRRLVARDPNQSVTCGSLLAGHRWCPRLPTGDLGKPTAASPDPSSERNRIPHGHGPAAQDERIRTKAWLLAVEHWRIDSVALRDSLQNRGVAWQFGLRQRGHCASRAGVRYPNNDFLAHAQLTTGPGVLREVLDASRLYDQIRPETLDRYHRSG